MGTRTLFARKTKMELKKAFEELKKEKKRKFVQSVDLIVNLHNYDVRKEALNTFVKLPNSNKKKIAAFLTKRSKIVETITEDDFTKYKEEKVMKKLAKNYDFFIAVAPMMPKIATSFGRVFGPMNKMPSPQGGIMPNEDEATISAMIETMGSMVRVRNKEMSIKMSIGKEDMDEAKLIENVESVVSQLEKKLPRGKENIKDAMVKFTMTKPIKFLDNIKK
jgi:large subunit ribosomal protein L1